MHSSANPFAHSSTNRVSHVVTYTCANGRSDGGTHRADSVANSISHIHTNCSANGQPNDINDHNSDNHNTTFSLQRCAGSNRLCRFVSLL